MIPEPRPKWAENPLRRQGVMCQVCAHPDRAGIELGLANKIPARVLAKRYGFRDHNTIARHKRNHMQPELIAHLMTRGRMDAVELENLRLVESEGVLHHLVTVRGRLYAAMDDAHVLEDYKAVATIADKISKNLEITAKLLGDINTGTVNVTNNLLLMPEYHGLRTAIMQALAKHPEAFNDVTAALRSYESPGLPSPETAEESAAVEPQRAKAREDMRRVRAKRLIEGEAARVRARK